ncbi:MAG: enoyl-CoA hydratase-related protein [Burkholderiales bacterium]|nr:enoyl-CoA hydratase-related protein [Burkholderiales bacterium]
MTLLEIEPRGRAVWLWLNRPEQRNALNAELQQALGEALARFERDPAVRALVIGGRGAAFCAGGDLARMREAARMTKVRARAEAARFARLLYRLHGYPKPVVARVHGAAFAGGFGLAAACDFVVAAEAAEFCLPEVRLGLVPAMIGPYLVRALGAQAARRYMLTGERLSAAEAQRLGFLHACVPAAELDQRIEALIAQLLAAGPRALAAAKRLLARIERAPITPRLATETAAVLAEVRAGAEAREGIGAFLEKRKPSWT